MPPRRSRRRSDCCRPKAPVLPETAAQIGDLQVRNMGTVGGSLAHADPAADYPAAVLALEAEIVAEGARGRRAIAAAAESAAEGVDVNADIFASADYRRHLAKVFTKRAVQAAIEQM